MNPCTRHLLTCFGDSYLLGMVLHSSFLFCHFLLPTFSVLQVVVGLPFLLILLCLYVVPFGTYSPCVQEKDKLAPKPDFFGHRGAPMVGLSLMDVGEYRCAWVWRAHQILGTPWKSKGVDLRWQEKKLNVETGLEPRSPNSLSISLYCASVTLPQMSRVSKSYLNKEPREPNSLPKVFSYWAPSLP